MSVGDWRRSDSKMGAWVEMTRSKVESGRGSGLSSVGVADIEDLRDDLPAAAISTVEAS